MLQVVINQSINKLINIDQSII